MDFDGLKKQAEGLVNEHSSEIEQGVDKVAELAKDKVGHDEQIDDAVDKLKGFLPDN